eukprot:TRINITY_DN70579_c0_g1_i1.p1 TRINITY_DN70579_c0_g1~~TRINITY_DN70579_c0_g1_i1.p1  ORF type:complete len:2764 (-),score=583.45 TRINITY_DN70579_c0_g1_i1:26-8317(-)
MAVQAVIRHFRLSRGSKESADSNPPLGPRSPEDSMDSSDRPVPRKTFLGRIFGGASSAGLGSWSSTRSSLSASGSFDVQATDSDAILESSHSLRRAVHRNKYSKQLFQERLVLEEAMCSQLCRCIIFLVQSVLFLNSLYIAYPAPVVLPVHQALENAVTLPQGRDIRQPRDVVTVDDLQEYLKGLASSLRDFSPGSSIYAPDPSAKSYLQGVTQFPPQQEVFGELSFQLNDRFTIATWVNTETRFDHIVRKEITLASGEKRYCWNFELEELEYGAHRSRNEARVINPLAASIYANSSSPLVAWRQSDIRKKFSDGNWHHFAVMVNSSHASFFHDGNLCGDPVPLPRPITDCFDGQVYIGSTMAKGALVDLKYIPRVLSHVELGFLLQNGKLLDDLLAGSGVSVGHADRLQTLSTATDRLATETHTVADGITSKMNDNFRNFEWKSRTPAEDSRRLKSATSPPMRQLKEDVPRRVKAEAQAARLAAASVARAKESLSARVKGARTLAEARRKESPADMMKRVAGLNPWRRSNLSVPSGAARRADVVRREGSRQSSRRLQSDGGGAACTDANPYCEQEFLGRTLVQIAEKLEQHVDSIADKVFPLVEAVCGPDMCSNGMNPFWIPEYADKCCHMFNAAEKGGAWCQDGAAPIRLGGCWYQCCLPSVQSMRLFVCLKRYYVTQVDSGQIVATLQPAALHDASNISRILPPNGECGRMGIDFDEATVAMTRQKIIDEFNSIVTKSCYTPAGPSATAFECARLCNTCLLDMRPSDELLLERLLSCQDAGETAYTDWMGQGCTWYRENDKIQDADGEIVFCKKYADENTREMCSLTCANCQTDEVIFHLLDFDKSATWDGQELNAMLHGTGDMHIYGTTLYMVEEWYTSFCQLVGMHGQDAEAWASMSWVQVLDDCVEGSRDGMPLHVLTHPGVRFDTYLVQKTQALLTEASVPIAMLSSNTADNFLDALVLGASNNFAIQAEQKMEPMYLECNTDADCANLSAYACADTMNQLNPLCGRGHAVPLYCGAACYTGGCGSASPALPGQMGRYCQPCDGCRLEETCPEHCQGWVVGADGSIQQIDDRLNDLIEMLEENPEDKDKEDEKGVAEGPRLDAVLAEVTGAVKGQGQMNETNETSGEGTTNETSGEGTSVKEASEDPLESPEAAETGVQSSGKAQPNSEAAAGPPADAQGGAGGPPERRLAEGDDEVADARKDFDTAALGITSRLTPGLPGSFTLMAWIRKFDFQWLFQKSVRIPGLDNSWDGYDIRTGELLCWRIGPHGAEFRNTWQERSMTQVENSLQNKLYDNGQQWHLLAFRKDIVKTEYFSSSGASLVEGVQAHFRFVVDGDEMPRPLDPFGNNLLFTSDNFPDCGGVMTLTHATTRELFLGHTFVTLPGIAERYPEGARTPPHEIIHLPFGGTGSGLTGFEFQDVQIPRGAFIKKAYLEICALAPSYIKAYEELCAAERPPEAISLKIVGLPRFYNAGPGVVRYVDQGDGTYFCPHLHTLMNNRTTREVMWNIDTKEWDERAINDNLDDEDKAASLTEEETVETDQCVFVTPDLTDIVRELVDTPSWQSGSGLSFGIAQASHDWDGCYPPQDTVTAAFMANLQAQFRMAETEGWCEPLRILANHTITHFPLWIAGRDIAAEPELHRKGASSPRLVVEYCLNEDCVNPTFLGVGETARSSVPKSAVSEEELVAALAASAQREAAAAGQPLNLEELQRAGDDDGGGMNMSAAEKLGGERRTLAQDAPRAGREARRKQSSQGRQDTAGERRLPKKPPKKGVARRGGIGGASRPAKARTLKAELAEAQQQASASDVLDATEGSGESCGDRGSCLKVGVAFDSGLPAEGLLYGAKINTRPMTTSELQTEYYAGMSTLKKLSGPTVQTAEQTVLDIGQYRSDLVSIIPPLVLQGRSEVRPCEEYIPGLSASLDEYFAKQIRGKCQNSYSCSFPASSKASSGFSCVDRTKSLDPQVEHFGKTAIQDSSGGVLYAEFLDLFTVPAVFRQGKVQNTSDWVDLQTSSVKVICVFASPTKRSGTIMTISFEITGPGKFSSDVSYQSYIQMTPEQEEEWALMTLVVMLMCVLDLFIIGRKFLRQFCYRRSVMKALAGVSKSSRAKARKQIPIVEPADLFDIGFRLFALGYNVLDVRKNASPYDHETTPPHMQVSHFERPIRSILDLDWMDTSKSLEEKVQSFQDLVIYFNENLTMSEHYRFFAKILTVMYLLRLIVYMKVHPQVATLYLTCKIMIGDFFHFLVLFQMIYGCMCFYAMWTLGDKMKEFRSMSMAAYTQFGMLVGEFILPEEGFTTSYAIYCIIFFVLVFTLLTNFFLALVVDSYAEVKEQVKMCKIVNSLGWDIMATFLYPIRARIRGWPQRGEMLKRLLKADLDGDDQNDEHDNEDVHFGVKDLVRSGVTEGSVVRAQSMMSHYMFVCPSIEVGYDPSVPLLEHQRLWRHMVVLDRLHFEARHAERRSSYRTKIDPKQLKTLQDMLHMQSSETSASGLEESDLKLDAGENSALSERFVLKAATDQSVVNGQAQTMNGLHKPEVAHGSPLVAAGMSASTLSLPPSKEAAAGAESASVLRLRAELMQAWQEQEAMREGHRRSLDEAWHAGYRAGSSSSATPPLNGHSFEGHPAAANGKCQDEPSLFVMEPVLNEKLGSGCSSMPNPLPPSPKRLHVKAEANGSASSVAPPATPRPASLRKDGLPEDFDGGCGCARQFVVEDEEDDNLHFTSVVAASDEADGKKNASLALKGQHDRRNDDGDATI